MAALHGMHEMLAAIMHMNRRLDGGLGGSRAGGQCRGSGEAIGKGLGHDSGRYGLVPIDGLLFELGR